MSCNPRWRCPKLSNAVRSFAVLLALCGSQAEAQLAARSPVGRRMPVPPRVQHRSWSSTSCGPAALATLLETYGRRVPTGTLEQASNAVGKKSTLEGLAKAARAAKFPSAVVQTTATALPAQPLPAVAEWRDGEFRVFISTGAAGVETFDPATGNRGWLNASALTAGWTGRLLLAHPTSVPAAQ